MRELNATEVQKVSGANHSFPPGSILPLIVYPSFTFNFAIPAFTSAYYAAEAAPYVQQMQADINSLVTQATAGRS